MKKFLVSILILLALLAAAALVAADRYLPKQKMSLVESYEFAASKILGLNDEYCLMRLDETALHYRRLAAFSKGNGCGFDVGIRASQTGKAALRYSPMMTCRLGEALAEWEDRVLQPLAERYLGQAVRRINHLGTYNCRTTRTSQTYMSQHAYANAIDVAGFVLDDGSAVSIERDWNGDNPKGRFLRALKEPTCDTFNGVITPDWDALHRNHFHLDMGRWWSCR